MAKMDPEEVRRRLEQEAADEALAKRLDNDPDFAKDFDNSFTQLFRGAEDDIIGRWAKAEGYSDDQIQKALETVQKARKTARGGFFVNADPEKAEKLLKDNAVLRGVHKAKKEKSCFLAALVLLASASLSIFGLYWATSRVIELVLS